MARSDVFDRIVIDGRTYVQLENRHPSLWWEERPSQQYKDGTAVDIDEIDDMRAAIKDLQAQRAELDKEIAEQIRYLDVAKQLKGVTRARPGPSYGNPSWYGGR